MNGERDDSIEFICCECGRHIIAVALELLPEPPLCGACLHVPGWFKDPQLRRALDPEHNGEEACEVKEGNRG